MTLTEEFLPLMREGENNPELEKEAAELVLSAPVTPESTGLLALIYHNGIGVETDFEKCLELAEKAAYEGNDPLGYYLLGYMCDNIKTTGQFAKSLKEKYSHSDAARFYEMCVATDSPWAELAHLWLGDFFMDINHGNNSKEGIKHYEAIGEFNSEAAGKLSDYYWDQLKDDNLSISPDERKELEKKVYAWTLIASELNPHDYSYRMGCCYAEGIDCDAQKGFRLARKYWEDAYDFGDWRAADSIALLYEERLNNLPADAPDTERQHCQRESASWRRLAQRAREREWAKEPDPSIEED